MGKYYMRVLIIVSIMVSIFLTYLHFSSEWVEIDDCEISITFYNKRNNKITRFVEKITEEERRKVFKIISKKKYSRLKYYCGFSKNIEINIANESFQLAGDGCSVLYHNEKECFVFLSDEEVREIHHIYSKYGGYLSV